MRLNGRREIMSYLGIRGFPTWYRLLKQGLPIHRTPSNRPFALTRELDRFEASSNRQIPRNIYGRDRRGCFISREEAGLGDARE